MKIGKRKYKRSNTDNKKKHLFRKRLLKGDESKISIMRFHSHEREIFNVSTLTEE